MQGSHPSDSLDARVENRSPGRRARHGPHVSVVRELLHAIVGKNFPIVSLSPLHRVASFASRIESAGKVPVAGRPWRRRRGERSGATAGGGGRVVDRPISFGRQRLDCAVVKPWLSD